MNWKPKAIAGWFADLEAWHVIVALILTALLTWFIGR
jgi:hypothetical protein